jgi:hypothetical protein
VNNNKSAQITFTTRPTECPPVMLNDEPIPTKNEVKYLGVHLDRRLTWKAHIKAKKQQLNIKTKQMNWLIGRKSQFSLEHKLVIHKVILKPIWTYGIELWRCAKPSNTKILQTYQSKTFRLMAYAPWYVSNQTLHDDLKIPFIKDVIHSQATKYSNRNTNHINELVTALTDVPPDIRRLNRQWPEDLLM